MTEDELVEKMAAAIFNCFYGGSSGLDEIAESISKDHARAALAIARPIIERAAFEKAAKVVDIAYHQEPFGDDATITIADDPTKIAAAIRALMEQSK